MGIQLCSKIFEILFWFQVNSNVWRQILAPDAGISAVPVRLTLLVRQRLEVLMSWYRQRLRRENTLTLLRLPASGAFGARSPTLVLNSPEFQKIDALNRQRRRDTPPPHGTTSDLVSRNSLRWSPMAVPRSRGLRHHSPTPVVPAPPSGRTTARIFDGVCFLPIQHSFTGFRTANGVPSC